MRIPLVVTTEFRGVFLGYGDPATLTADKTFRLEDAQMCVYWSEAVQGVLGLAGKGATDGCRISPPIPAITLTKVTGIMEATESAAKTWTSQKWKKQ